ncbi:UDP-glucose 4-epimerase GalE [Yoonia tamlensis]|uniref:UDP-glucose 4-epimerase GalE n=1 Tax=Yoonia tamlensis TaxID=390270 RepID=UPI000B7F0F33|nr:UDP-glucose 4-epimerase GalE [Yoonia tamlensis]
MGTAVLVTGGAGFIGSHACKALAAQGYLPVTIDNLSTGHADAVRYGPLVRADIRDSDAVNATIRSYDIAAIIHFAASAYVGESVQDPLAYYRNNIGGMTALLQAAQGAGIKRIVFSSSCATYGVPRDFPITENYPQRPINPYGRTKLIGEQMLADMAVAHGITYAALRYFNAAGADPDGVLGERHAPETHLIPLALLAAAGNGPALTVFGTDYPTPDGTCVRDYIHVDDLARAHVAALAHLLAGGETLHLNLGSGFGLSIRDVIAGIEAFTGAPLPVCYGPRRAGDPPILTADPAAAARLLGFKTRLSDLPTLLAHAAPWFGVKQHEKA